MTAWYSESDHFGFNFNSTYLLPDLRKLNQNNMWQKTKSVVLNQG